MAVVDYIWLGGNLELRSKVRVLPLTDGNLQIPEWNFDGSSTNQADGSNSEIFLKPRAFFPCPFRKSPNYIALCDTYDKNGPAKNNNRVYANLIFEKYKDQKPWYGLEQEYFIFDKKTNLPLGYNESNKQGQYYCSVGSLNAYGREISDQHLKYCLYAGIKISGTNAEVAPGQWEFQIGPVEGIKAADQLWVARYILEKISEKYEAYIVFHPKPIKGDWNGSGCHTNFSTEAMRNAGGYEIIIEAIKKLESKHSEHMLVYGDNNDERMTGEHETSNYNSFSYGVANRKASIRIPTDTYNDGYGYFEDRRPASNMDPYLVTAKILETIME
ncbi:glutamine synthetase [Hokovirus HKV1]|uniref:glutamine synthetase n=1 Tax=Hokovirus HKV1 TaxID=1977638 RepID=A0A1V0SG77_9VIRU|nr:glutamine synthetase [Hokovirus HKV1]